MFRLLVLSVLVAISLAAELPPLLPRLDGRIVGGRPATIEQYPHQLSLLLYGSHICGASIVSSNYALTAAHCTDGSSASSLSVRAGSSYRGQGGEVVAVSRIIQHSRYNSRTIDYDISLLQLARALQLGRPIYLVSQNQNVSPGTAVAVSGWGAMNEGGSPSSQLQAVTISIVSRQTCRNAYGESAITDRMICAGVPAGGKDSCQGDSGGPMKIDGANMQAGVVSWGYGCARPGYPGVYSNVAYLRRIIVLEKFTTIMARVMYFFINISWAFRRKTCLETALISEVSEVTTHTDTSAPPPESTSTSETPSESTFFANFADDPALWPQIIPDKLRLFLAEHGPRTLERHEKSSGHLFSVEKYLDLKTDLLEGHAVDSVNQTTVEREKKR
ncbi:hypothetical protein ILUMI_25893 [Ignelater luminosus]|uniref:Peptidase S1 domain-containing protein n=1 Tax=Ignelater luminosus TaxID=2038154 RepID=A0A8K0CAS3_IGNLU|nr:hypothetical protein ILUMI_25893 [Ignelater luminosus]